MLADQPALFPLLTTYLPLRKRKQLTLQCSVLLLKKKKKVSDSLYDLSTENLNKLLGRLQRIALKEQVLPRAAFHLSERAGHFNHVANEMYQFERHFLCHFYELLQNCAKWRTLLSECAILKNSKNQSFKMVYSIYGQTPGWLASSDN